MNGHSVTMAGEIPRRYWTIGELAEQMDVAPSMLRYWQTEFGFDVHRDKKGDRRFTADEAERVKEIHRLLKVEGYTIRGAKRQLLMDAKKKTDLGEYAQEKILRQERQLLMKP